MSNDVIDTTATAEKSYSFGKIGQKFSSLIGDSKPAEDAQQAQAVDPSGLKFVETGKLRPSQYQPRTEFNAEALKELADSIARNGIIQPIVVRSRNREEFEIIAGERRWRAARILNLPKVPVVVRQLTDREVIEIALVENIQRRDLNALEEAYGYRRLLGEFGYTQDDLSRVVGKSRSHVANLLRLLSLPESVKTLINEDKLSMSHARALVGSDKADEIALKVIEFGLSVRETEALAQQIVLPNAVEVAAQQISSAAISAEVAAQPQAEEAVLELVESPTATEENAAEAKEARKERKYGKTQDILDIEAMVSRNLGAFVDIRSRGKKGEIRIKYRTLQELDGILARLG